MLQLRAQRRRPPIVRQKDTPRSITATSADKVVLDASASADPDKDPLKVRWWHFREAGGGSGAEPPQANGGKTTVTIPPDAKPAEEIHVICEVTDGGFPPLTRYQRVVIRVEPG